MNSIQREQVLRIVEHFSGKTVTQDTLDEFCNLHKFEKYSVGQISDYEFQINHDKVIAVIFPLILAEVQKLRYVPEYDTVANIKAIEAQNEEVQIEIAKILEEHAIKYRFVVKMTEDLASLVGRTIEQSGTIIFNRASEVLRRIAHDKYGEEFNAKHARDYIIKVFEESTGTKYDPNAEVKE